jgi:hypothetical protein
MKNPYSVNDVFEGIILETTIDNGISRPRVRPIEYFENDIRVEFPRYLREENPIGTRFRADVKVCQKTSNNKPIGQLYLRANTNNIEKIENHKPIRNLFPIKLNSISDRSYEYVTKHINNEDINFTTLKDLRKIIYNYLNKSVSVINQSDLKNIDLIDLINTYVLARANDRCECCGKNVPFLKRNGNDYLEIINIKSSSNNSDYATPDFAAICPECKSNASISINHIDITNNLRSKINELEKQFT